MQLTFTFSEYSMTFWRNIYIRAILILIINVRLCKVMSFIKKALNL